MNLNLLTELAASLEASQKVDEVVDHTTDDLCASFLSLKRGVKAAEGALESVAELLKPRMAERLEQERIDTAGWVASVRQAGVLLVDTTRHVPFDLTPMVAAEIAAELAELEEISVEEAAREWGRSLDIDPGVSLQKGALNDPDVVAEIKANPVLAKWLEIKPTAKPSEAFSKRSAWELEASNRMELLESLGYGARFAAGLRAQKQKRK